MSATWYLFRAELRRRWAAWLGVALTAVRRRRREPAILRTLGVTRWQVLSTVTWQGTVLVVTAAVVVGATIAAIPGWSATRAEPSAVLRSE